MNKKIRVLIVDDSAAVREALSEVINADPDLEVMATASDPMQAVRRIRDERPDVITLDVEMPGMDGITFLRKLMAQHPIPVVMCSTLMEEKSTALVDALSAGAVDVIQKPKFGTAGFFEESCRTICDTVRAASGAKPRAKPAAMAIERKMTADEVLPPPSARRARAAGPGGHFIAIGSSTGGTEALNVVLTRLPADSPPIVIVQHMPKAFTGAFAQRLDGIAKIRIKEAANGDRLERGLALVAPGGIHTIVTRRGAHYEIELRDGPLVARHKPSADVLFRSVARCAGAGATGVILTGMGDDGARGLREMLDAGASTIGQDEATCVVYGMPKAAFEVGAVQVQLPLEKIGASLAHA